VAVLHRLGRDGQAHADLVGAAAIQQQAQDLELPRGQFGKALRGRSMRARASSGAMSGLITWRLAAW
jgi:hypothetical protein